MTNARLRLASRCLVLFGAAAMLSSTATPAAAQTQSIPVDCTAGGRINTALAAITDRSAPNVITVFGMCSAEVVNVTGFNRLTIQGGGGASITTGMNILNSRNIVLKSLTFTLSNPGGFPQ